MSGLGDTIGTAIGGSYNLGSQQYSFVCQTRNMLICNQWYVPNENGKWLQSLQLGHEEQRVRYDVFPTVYRAIFDPGGVRRGINMQSPRSVRSLNVIATINQGGGVFENTETFFAGEWRSPWTGINDATTTRIGSCQRGVLTLPSNLYRVQHVHP